MKELTLDWVYCSNLRWCELQKVNLDNDKAGVTGVYVIAYLVGEDGFKAVKVGQSRAEDGGISTRLRSHRKGDTDESKEILSYEDENVLHVTWAEVPVGSLNGVERFLGDTLIQDPDARFPNAEPIEVNLPSLG